MNKKLAIKVYHGFGHVHELVVMGHVFRKNARKYQQHSSNPLVNLIRLLRVFFLKPVAEIPLIIKWEDKLVEARTETDGFFRADFQANHETDAGWHDVTVSGANPDQVHPATGKVFVPNSTQYGFISDIDDTILVSHSATISKRLKELLFKNPEERDVYANVGRHYSMLAHSHTTPEAPNPFFYVSSSEWNLYDYLDEVFIHHQLPKGAFLLNQFKHWYQLWKTGKTKHEGKLLRIIRILEVFPKQKFVLFGDNSQSDPAIYEKITEKYGSRIHCVYIRNVSSKNEATTYKILQQIEVRGIHTCLFKESMEAIEHSIKIGLIAREVIASV